MFVVHVYAPAAEEDVVGPHHGEGQQLVERLQLEVRDVPQDELPPGLPVLLTLPVTPTRLHLLGHGPVLLDKVLHVQGRHVAPLSSSQQRRLPGSAPDVVFQVSVF